MKKPTTTMLATAMACTLTFGPAVAAEPAAFKNPVAGQKIDSGLGELPHYRYWTDKSGRNPVTTRVAGEKLDSGLGEIAPYSLGRTGTANGVDVAQRK